MDTPKISKLLRLMKLLTGNVSRTTDSLARELGITARTVYRYIDTIREDGVLRDYFKKMATVTFPE